MAHILGAVVSTTMLLAYGIAFIQRPGRDPAKRKIPGFDWIRPIGESLKRFGVPHRWTAILQRPRMLLAFLEGGICPPERLLRWTAETTGIAYAVIFSGWLMTALTGNMLIGAMGSLIGACVPLLRVRDLEKRMEARKRQVLMELPVMISQLVVLVNAGENVVRALARSAQGKPSDRHPLYLELHAALAAIDRGESMTLALEEFGKRCVVPEAKLFSAVLLMNAKRGGEELVPALQDLNRQMWDKRKTAARTLGEQASSRMTFPLAVIFLLIVVLVGAPAVMSF